MAKVTAVLAAIVTGSTHHCSAAWKWPGLESRIAKKFVPKTPYTHMVNELQIGCASWIRGPTDTKAPGRNTIDNMAIALRDAFSRIAWRAILSFQRALFCAERLNICSTYN